MLASVEIVAGRITGHFARRVPWIDRKDIEQEAWIAGMESIRTWKDGGAPLEAYVWQAMHRRVGSYVIRATAPPLSAGRAKSLYGLEAVSLDGMSFTSGAVDAETALSDEKWLREVRAAFVALSKREGLEELVMELLRASRPRDIRAKKSMEREVLRLMRQKLAYHAKKDEVLRRLWEER